MRGPLLAAGLALAALAPAAAPPNAAAAGRAPAIVTVNATSVNLMLGQNFSFTSTVRSRGTAPALIVHLNVLSRDPSVYVDPEDWSSARTRYLTVPTGGITNLRWALKAVNSGSFVVYVAVMSQDGSGPIAASGPLRVRVGERRTLNPGGALPLAVGVPAALAALLVGRSLVARRRRRIALP